MNRILLFCICLAALTSHAAVAGAGYSCEASPQIQEKINLANTSSIDSLLSTYPDNFWVQRRYIEMNTGAPIFNSTSQGMPVSQVDPRVIEKFKTAYEKQPDNPEAAFLYAYSLIHTDTAKAIEILTDITGKAPDFPSPWFTLSVLHGYSNFNDQGKRIHYTEEFIARCPDTVEPRIASNALQLNKSDILERYIRSLRKRIAGREDEKLLVLYNYLWQLEMKFAPPDRTDFYRKRIREDLKFIESLDKTRFTIAQNLLVQGYSQIGDQKALNRLIEQSPNSSGNLTLFLRARSDWTRSNPPPAPNAEPEKFIEYFRKELEFLNKWTDRLPDSSITLDPQFQALASIPETPDAELIYTGSRILSMAERSRNTSAANAALTVLETWADRDIQLDRIPALVNRFRVQQPQSPSAAALRIKSDILSTRSTEQVENLYQWRVKSRAWSVLTAVYTKKDRIDQVKGILAEWEKALEERRKEVNEFKNKQIEAARARAAANSGMPSRNPFNFYEYTAIREFPKEEAKLYEGSARLAAAEGRSLEAVLLYQSAIRLLQANRTSPADFLDIERTKAAGSQLWNKLGRDRSEWDAWVASLIPARVPSGSATPRQSMNNRAIPDFSLADQKGNTWTLAELKGKTTLINVWATWCGPCRMELPHLQKLHEKIKDRDDIQVITLNIDEDKSKVEPFLKDNHFTFPSLYAPSFVRNFAGPVGIPTTWIADPSGNIRFESLGYRDNGGRWVDETLEELDKISNNKAQK